MSWLDFFRAKKEEQDQIKKSDPSFTFSSTGTEIYSGYLEEEFLGELRDMRRRFDIYDEMRRGSGVINMCLNAVLRPIESAKWNYKIMDKHVDDPMAVLQLDFIEQAFPKNFLRKLVSEMSLALLYGFSLHEKFYSPFIFNGQTKLRPFAKFISQRTIKRWLVDLDSTWMGVDQEAYGDTSDNQQKTISSKSLIHFAFNQEGDNYEGISLLRPIYGNWVRKNVNFTKVAIGNNFLALPFLKIYQEMAGLSEDDWKKFEERLQNRSTLTKILNHLVFPPGITAEEQGSNFDPMKLYDCNSKEDEEIIRSFSCNFLLLTKGSGSFALSKDLSNFFTSGLEVIAANIDAKIDDELIKETIMMNFGVEPLVECTHSEIGGKGGKDLAGALSSLFSSKSITPDEMTESWIRNKYGLPPADLETRRKPEPIVNPLVKTEDKDDDNDDDEDDKSDDIDKSKKLSVSRAGLLSEAKKSVKKILKMRDEGLSLLKNKLTELANKKTDKAVAHFKKNKGTQKVFSLKPSMIEVGTAPVIKAMKDFLQQGVNEQISDLQTALSLTSPNKSSILSIVAFMAATDVEEAVTAIDNAVMFTYFESVSQGQDLNDIKLVLTQATKSVVEGKKIAQKTSVLPGKAVNLARQKVFEENYSDIESYTFYNPDPQAPVCVEIAGKTVAAGDPALKTYQPPLHYNCSTVIIPNTTTMKNNPTPRPIAISQKAEDSINIGVKSALY